MSPTAVLGDSFALLDDAGATDTDRRSRLYLDYVRQVVCVDPHDLDAWYQDVEQALAAGLHAVLLADYEWGVRLQGRLPRLSPLSPLSTEPSLRVLVFRQCQRFSASDTEAWLARAEGSEQPGIVGLMESRDSVTDAEFDEAIRRIHAAIHAGETYQVNYSYRLHARLAGSPLALYRRLRERQPVAYGAFIALPEGKGGETSGQVSHVLSFSPELFLRHERGTLTAKPMKGTAPRCADVAMDLLAREQLATAKSRAENLMIVDLLRNDLGRVARIGSVKVPALFEVEGHPSVWQMTSTITAQRAPGQRLPDLLRALFPCGSITGAPKHQTLGLITELETTPRDLYCGALGWLDQPAVDADCPDFCLSVPIRTLLLRAPTQGWRALELGLGAGIVADSDAAQERAECRLKAQFFRRVDSEFALIETLYVSNGEPRHGARHLARLQASAEALGFVWPEGVESLLHRYVATLPGAPHRVRLLLSPEGGCTLSHARLDPTPAEPVKLLLAEDAMDPDAWLLAHKTTVRARYEQGLAHALARGAFDLLYFNTRGELTEGARSNVFIRLDGEWLTPALACGLLPGIQRSVLLDDPAWQARETIITRDMLRRAEDIVVCNALRGPVHAFLSEPSGLSG